MGGQEQMDCHSETEVVTSEVESVLGDGPVAELGGITHQSSPVVTSASSAGGTAQGVNRKCILLLCSGPDNAPQSLRQYLSDYGYTVHTFDTTNGPQYDITDDSV